EDALLPRHDFVRSLNSAEPATLQVAHQLYATIYLKLVIDVMQMELGGALRDRELLRDRLVVHSLGRHLRHLQLTRRERFRYILRPGFALEQPLDCLRGVSLLEPSASRVNFAD